MVPRVYPYALELLPVKKAFNHLLKAFYIKKTLLKLKMMAKVLTLDQKETVLMCCHASEQFWSSMQEASRNSETHWFTLFRRFFIFFVQTLPLFTNLASSISSGLPHFSPFFTSHLLILLFHLCLTNLTFGFTFLSKRHSVLSTLSITTFYHFINNLSLHICCTAEVN